MVQDSIIDSIIADRFHDFNDKIRQKTAKVSQDFIKRGLSNSTACTGSLISVHFDLFSEYIDNTCSFIRENKLILDWDYLEKCLYEKATHVHQRAVSVASQHLVNAGFVNLIKSIHNVIDGEKKKSITNLNNKINLLKTLRNYEANQASANEYDQILDIIRHAGATYEVTPATYKDLEEESLRDILLSHLNGRFQGKATGETFRKEGKTDIRIEYENRAAFVAECKIWHGDKKVLETVDQLLGYLTWRDEKTCIIIFNKEVAGFSSIQQKVPSIFESHPNYIRCTDSGKTGEWRYVFKSKDDADRQITVHVFLFNLYVSK